MSNEIVKANDDARGRAFIDLLKKTDKKRPKQEDVQAFRKMLTETPALWRMCGDLAEQAMMHTVKKVQSTEAIKSSLTTGLGVIKNDLGYQNAPALERLLIDHVAMCWLRMSLTEYQYTSVVMNESIRLAVGDFYERRLGATQRRYLRACETLARVRKLTRRTPALQVNIATEGGQQIIT